MSDSRITRPFGLWDSPISPLGLSQAKRFSDMAWDESGALVWLEGRSDRNVLVVQADERQAARDVNDELAVRARVGYGGGDFTVGAGNIYFIEAHSGRVYRQSLHSGPARAITPGFGHCAAPRLSPDGRWLLYIHTYEDRDCLAIQDAQGSTWPQKLVDQADFFMQPAWHPDGRRIAWVEWNHPDMPWDSTRLVLAELEAGDTGLPALVSRQQIAGGRGESVLQPEFSPDGRSLVFISDIDGWWHLHRLDLQTGERRPLTRGEAEHGSPAWVQGQRNYAFAPHSNRLYYIRNQQGYASLWSLDLQGGDEHQLVLDEEYTWLEQIAVAPDGQRVSMLASGAGTPTRLIVYSLDGKTRIVSRSSSEATAIENYSTAQAVSYRIIDGTMVHGLFYPPANPAFQGIGLPPLVLLVHGGPTSQRTANFDGQVQFFTSRGFAVLQSNYRGSSGYGRAYRELLVGNWGVYDVEDCVSGVRYLAERGLVDANKVVIMGGSAGGFTVLKALEDYPGFFKAGIDLFGVSNQFSLAKETHKFEAHYSDRLLGPLPEATEIYYQRSPINFADQIRDPLAVFQGEVDQVVPRSQSDEIVASLRRRGVAHVYHVYPGEGHGFRKAETIEHFYREVERFLHQHVIFA